MFYFGSNKIRPLNRNRKLLGDRCWYTILPPFQGLILCPKSISSAVCPYISCHSRAFFSSTVLRPNSEQKWVLFSQIIYISILLWPLKILKVRLVRYSSDVSLDLKCNCWVSLYKWVCIKLSAIFIRTIP